MNYYGINDYRYYHLAHFGVPGMKWGVRKARKEYGIRRRMVDRMYGHMEKTGQIANNVKKAKGFKNKASELLGNGRARTVNHVREATEKRLAKHSRTALGKAIHNQRAANARYMSKYYGKMQSATLGERVFENTVFRKNLVSTPYRRLSGRNTTVGKEIIDRAFTGGIAGVIGDIKYMNSKKR